jgi:hypothetical protein
MEFNLYTVDRMATENMLRDKEKSIKNYEVI